jgi:hypothetical protein
MYLCIRQTTIEIYDGIDIPSSLCGWTDVVNCICLHQFTRIGRLRPSWVVWPHSVLSGSIERMITLQDTTDTTQADTDTIFSLQMMPHHLSTALQCVAYLHDSTHNRVADGV